ncbi:hypothetical protein BYT27DRAFT_7221677 [Phlegmacium glaucopus]|nr:hypothetical protein BYT27DRAFT_7221677 [Phlegmacium glaucopus]
MPAGAVWTAAEETALVNFLEDNKAEAGDGGNFKTTTFQWAVSQIAPLHERGLVKTVKSTHTKWISFWKIYRIIRAIQLVSGWVWDDDTGASITANSASSWDDYVKKHPEAKPKVASIMPFTPAGAHVFYPIAGAPTPIDDSDRLSSPEPTPPPASSSDSQDLDNSDNEEVCHLLTLPFKTLHLKSMSASLVGFGNDISAALAPPAPVMQPSPVRRTNAVSAVIRLEADWLTLGQQVAFIDFLRNDRTAADIYTALTETDVCKEWVRIQLEQLGVMVF